MLDIMYDVSISALNTTTTGMVELIMHDVSISLRTTTKEGWWSVGYHVRCIHLSTVNYNYDEGGMVEYWRSCTMYPSQHG